MFINKKFNINKIVISVIQRHIKLCYVDLLLLYHVWVFLILIWFLIFLKHAHIETNNNRTIAIQPTTPFNTMYKQSNCLLFITK